VSNFDNLLLTVRIWPDLCRPFRQLRRYLRKGRDTRNRPTVNTQHKVPSY